MYQKDSFSRKLPPRRMEEREGSVSEREDRSPLPSSRKPRRREDARRSAEGYPTKANDEKQRMSMRHRSKADKKDHGSQDGERQDNREVRDIHSILNGLPKASSRRNMSVEPQGMSHMRDPDEQVERGKDVLRLLRRVQQDSQRLCSSNSRHGQILPELLVASFEKETEEMKDLYQQSSSNRDVISSDLRACHHSLRNLVKSVKVLLNSPFMQSG